MNEEQTLRARVPGQSVMSDFVVAQREAPSRSALARFFGVSPLTAANRVRFRGALGELLVGDALDHLGPEWDILHAVPVDANSYEIDHLVIGPPGVFTVLTKNHPGQEVWVGGDAILVGGTRQNHITTARFEATTAAELLSAAAGHPIEVDPLLVMVNPKRLGIREQPAGVVVLSSRQLVKWLTRLERVLNGTDVAFVSDVADRTTTWQTRPAPAQDTEQLHRDFAIVRAEVVTASRRRTLWVALGFLGVCAAIWGAVAAIVVNFVVLR